MKQIVWLAVALSGTAVAQNAQWKFAVSGDSRNCGDIVMPAIAQGVRQSGAEFYWHLGDFRAIYTFDEDLVPPASLGLPPKPMSIAQYESAAWPDFIAHQLGPFGDLPVFLSPGNHEMIPPQNRDEYLAQFADWLETPLLREQRLKDNPKDHKLRTYFHWIKGNVDFIALDNASADQFDGEQMTWIREAIKRDEESADIRTIVIGMHEALPDSWSESHSMSESGQGERTGREVYEELLHAQNSAHKHVYVLASHSHFYMEDIFHTDAWKGKVLPGWIVGTAGAQRYVLPKGVNPGSKAMTDVYGYLVATVGVDGSISTSFERLSLDDLMKANPNQPEPLVRWCFEENKQ
jgi:Calcineurin-like phosphoesterase